VKVFTIVTYLNPNHVVLKNVTKAISCATKTQKSEFLKKAGLEVVVC
jgi:hypothetical protein